MWFVRKLILWVQENKILRENLFIRYWWEIWLWLLPKLIWWEYFLAGLLDFAILLRAHELMFFARFVLLFWRIASLTKKI